MDHRGTLGCGASDSASCRIEQHSDMAVGTVEHLCWCVSKCIHTATSIRRTSDGYNDGRHKTGSTWEVHPVTECIACARRQFGIV